METYDNMTYQNLGDAAKTELKGEFIANGTTSRNKKNLKL